MPRVGIGDVGVVTPDRFKVSFRWIDATGDPRAVSITLNSAPSFVNLEAFIVKQAAQSNANMYAVHYNQVWGLVTGDLSDAINATRASVSQVLHITARNATGDKREMYLPAPIEASFVANTDTPDMTDAAMIALVADFVNLLPVGFAANTIKFAGHQEKNQVVKI